MVTAAKLQAHTARELAQIARSEGVRGWHAMRKAELIEALLATSQRCSQPPVASGGSTRTTAAVSRTAKPVVRNSRVNAVDVKIANRIRAERQRQESQKDLSLSAAADSTGEVIERDRIVLVVRDAWWVQAYWEVTRSSAQRARVALGQHWHTAQPTLRLLKITNDGNTNSVEQIVQDLAVSGDARNWFINIPSQASTYRVAIGYATDNDQFHVIAKSNEVIPPVPSSCGIEDNWADISVDAQHYYALSGGQDDSLQSGDLRSVFEQRTHQPVASEFAEHSHSAGTHQPPLSFEVDAQMVVYGSTQPTASVTIGGQPARVQPDGSFAMRVNMPDRRQVLPVVATNCDGTQQRTTVLAVERNTKSLDLLQRDPKSLT